MRARLRVTLNAKTMPQDQKHLRDHTQLEKMDLVGDDATSWEQARASVNSLIPDGALALHYSCDQ